MNAAKEEISWRKRAALYLLGVMSLLFALVPIARQPVMNFDESFTVNLIRSSWGGMIRFTALDVHPPLYYLAVKLVVCLFGERLLAFHLVSLVCFLGLLVITGLFFERYFSGETAALIVLGLCGVPGMLSAAIQVRMYSMAMLWVAASFYLTYLIAEHYGEQKCRRYWIFFALSNVAAAYTHYFAGVAAVMLSLFLLGYLLARKNRLKKVLLSWGSCCIAMFVLYLPWIFVLAGQMRSVGQDYWITQEELQMPKYIQKIFQMPAEQLTHLLMLVFFLGIFFWIRDWKGESRQLWLAGGFLVPALWFCFGMGVSLLWRPILIDRYLTIVIPLMWIAVIGVLAGRFRSGLKACLILLFALCFMQSAQDVQSGYDGTDTLLKVRFLQEHVQEEDVIFCLNVKEMSVNMVYLPEMDYYILKGADTEEAFKYWEEMTDCVMLEDMSQLVQLGGDVWCLRGDWQQSFSSLGYRMEVFEVGSGEIYRFYQQK